MPLRPHLPFQALVALSVLLGAASAAGALALLSAPPAAPRSATPLPETATIPAGAHLHRLDGEYSRAGRPVDAPHRSVRMAAGVEIMRFQVTVADYRRCVAAGACRPPDAPASRGGGDVPVTGVSFTDATDYAAWLSRETGLAWRLPTDAEWARAAGSRFADDARGLDGAATNPALRWLADYDREAERGAARDRVPRPSGSFGANEHGVFDMAGNVWEWTQTCFRRVSLDAKGRVTGETRNCGILVAEGRHRAMMTFFIRNPRNGGCSVGTPPDNLGFRLVLERPWRQRLRGLVSA